MTSSTTPTRVRAGAVRDFAEGDRVLVPNGDYTIGVFRVDGTFRAYDNICLHQGGPVCEGRYFPLMTAVIDEGGRVLGERYDESEPHLVCPWHGWEYDLRTGEFCGDRRRSLRTRPVVVEGEDVYVVLD
ncbi:MAG: Rieske (2Fe-2S) protein [Pseudonocardia sp.]